MVIMMVKHTCTQGSIAIHLCIECKLLKQFVYSCPLVTAFQHTDVMKIVKSVPLWNNVVLFMTNP